MTRSELVMAAADRLPRRYERRIHKGHVRVLGGFYIMRMRRVVVLRIVNQLPMGPPHRHVSHVVMWEVRQPGGRYRIHATHADNKIDWTLYQPDLFVSDCPKAMARLKEKHERRADGT